MNLAELKKNCGSAQILAVSKLQSEEKIRELYHEGQRFFGENYVQEALLKIDHLHDLKDLQWHLIGHLQKNKINSILGKFAVIHSVDSLELAQALSQKCDARSITQRILLQINLAGEDSKGGFSKEELEKNWLEISQLPALQIDGLMTMPPLDKDGESVRVYFAQLREMLRDLQTKADLVRHPLHDLSMGTSHDYPVAIQEGATLVRLGTILFGERTVKR